MASEKKIIAITSGHYSDYTIHGIFSIDVGVDTRVYVPIFRHEQQEAKKYSSPENFIEFLLEKKVIEKIPFNEFFINDQYGRHIEIVETEGPRYGN